MMALAERHTLQLIILGFDGAMLAFHVSAVAAVVSVHADFRLADEPARGDGVLIEYPFAGVPAAE